MAWAIGINYPFNYIFIHDSFKSAYKNSFPGDPCRIGENKPSQYLISAHNFTVNTVL